VHGFKFKNIVYNGVWQITDRTLYFANEWYEKLKEFMDKKVEMRKNFLRNTPFLNADGKSHVQWLIPTFGQVDSLTEFETEDVGKLQDENELGDSGGNTIHMRQGLAKIRFLSDVLKRSSLAAMPILLTAHVGKDIPMDARAGPIKKLQFLRNGDKVKGVTDKFFFLTSLVLQCQNAAPFVNKETKAAEYPLDSSDNSNKGDTDLNTITAILLRNKNGPTGHILPLIISQRDGVLSGLTEFHYCKENDRYGLEGNMQNYTMALRPSVKLSRTSVRSKIDADPLLDRAINITSEMCQIKNFWHHIGSDLMCTPKQLHDDLVALGYDWDVLLKTRGWWSMDNDSQDLPPFLSTMDLLRMRKGLYHPYWLAEDKKTRLNMMSKEVKVYLSDLIEKTKKMKLEPIVQKEEDFIEA
jgi:hypothetical protein